MLLEEYLKYIQKDKENLEEIIPALAIAAYGLSIFYNLIKGYQQFLQDAARKCNGITDYRMKERCMISYKIEANKKLVNDLNSNKSKCGEDKACLNKFEKKQIKVLEKVKKFEDQYRRVFKKE